MLESIGLLPLAGNATRMKHLPKFLLPCGNGGTLLDYSLSTFKNMNISNVVAGVSENNSQLLAPYSSFEKHIMATKTMSETIYKLIQESSSKTYIMLMPDTYFNISPKDFMITNHLKKYSIVVYVWEINDYQIGKVGQCNIVDNKLIDIKDKDPTCVYKYVWGIIGWTSDMNKFIDPNWNTVGNLIKKALELNIDIGVFIMPGRYYDCGTFEEYISFVKNEL